MSFLLCQPMSKAKLMTTRWARMRTLLIECSKSCALMQSWLEVRQLMRPTVFGFLVCTVAAAALASTSRAADPRPPNIVLIVSDDHAWTDYSFMGHAQVRTPNLDRLAGQSLV